MKKIFISLIALLMVTAASAAKSETKKSKKGVKYKRSKKIDFESLLIQGERKRADIIVVTGDADDDLGGLLRLRENFLDHQAQNFGEVIE